MENPWKERVLNSEDGEKRKQKPVKMINQICIERAGKYLIGDEVKVLESGEVLNLKEDQSISIWKLS